jgi:hypothetical protein
MGLRSLILRHIPRNGLVNIRPNGRPPLAHLTCIVVAALLPFMGIPRLVHALNTVSTDDACVKIRDFRRFALERAVR